MPCFRKINTGGKSMFHNGNYPKVILDEIALEGLDGITVDALVMRLAQRKDLNFSFDEPNGKEFIFQIVKAKIKSQSENEQTETIQGKSIFTETVISKHLKCFFFV